MSCPLRIAFYAPLKAPDRGPPSGDQMIARLLIAALTAAGAEVEIVSRLRSFDRTGDPLRQQRIAGLGERLAARLLGRFKSRPKTERPDLWLTYHLYHKAPDHLGPAITRALGLPYAVAEASVSETQRSGPWAAGWKAVTSALRAADLVVGLNPADAPGLAPYLKTGARQVALPPFIDAAPFRGARDARNATRTRLAAAHGLDPARPWIAAVAMMRADQKLLSYRCLARAWAGLDRPGTPLLVAGDGPARGEVEAAFSGLAGPVVFLGALDRGELARVLAACDILAWPGIKEAIGVAYLEAMAAGLAVVAGDREGIAQVIRSGMNGVLVPEGEPEALARALRTLIDDPSRRLALAAAAGATIARDHDLTSAGPRLLTALQSLVTQRVPA